MRSFRAATGAAVAALALSACYHAVITTGKPMGTTVVENKWASSFIDGLVPPAPVDVSGKCPSGVAKVETQHSFLNGLAAGITFGLYTPITITVTCASGGTASAGDGAAPTVIDARTSDTPDQAQAALTRAVVLSANSGEPVFVRF